MNPVIYDLSYDFIQQNGNYMVFIEKNKRLLESDDLVSLQMKMIRSNVIPFFVPLIIEEMDFKVRLHYEITSKKMFSVYLKEKALSRTEYYALFLKIIEVLEDSQLYLLDQNSYLLKQDFIFIGKDIQDVFLTYLPLKGISGKGPVVEELKDLLIHVASQTDGLKGSEFKSILRFVDEPSFNLGSLKELLTELQSNQKHPKSSKPEEAVHASSEYVNEQPEESLVSESQVPFHEPFLSNPAYSPPKSEDLSDTDQAEESGSMISQREKIVMGAFTVVALALIWKFRGYFPMQYSLNICSGLSILVILSVYFYLKKRHPVYKQTNAESAAALSEEGLNAFNSQSLPLYREVESKPLLWKDMSENLIQYSNHSEEYSEEYYDHLNENTTLLPQSNDTVILEGEVHESRGSYLIKEHDGDTEKINLIQPSFIIGRNPETVQYVLESESVSRSHLEITMSDNEYSVKDLGSKNGSLLNDKVLVPYKMYALKDQDKITIGKVHFSFRTGS